LGSNPDLSRRAIRVVGVVVRDFAGFMLNVEGSIMSDKPWKQAERIMSKFFNGAGRTPLSGGNSKHTRADVMHPSLFVEVKHGLRFEGLFKLFDQTRKFAHKENKIPVVALHAKGRMRYLLLIDSAHLQAIADEAAKTSIQDPPTTEGADDEQGNG
jgi:hypothetical protein